jgi:hypothetical protein
VAEIAVVVAVVEAVAAAAAVVVVAAVTVVVAVVVAAAVVVVVVAEEDPEEEEDIFVGEDILYAGDRDNFVEVGHMGNVVLLVGHKVASVHPADPGVYRHNLGPSLLDYVELGNLPEVHILVEDQHEVLEAVDVSLVRVNLKSAFPVVQSND